MTATLSKRDAVTALEKLEEFRDSAIALVNHFALTRANVYSQTLAQFVGWLSYYAEAPDEYNFFGPVTALLDRQFAARAFRRKAREWFGRPT